MAYLEVFSISEESFSSFIYSKICLNRPLKKTKHWHRLAVDEIVYFNHILAVL